MAHFHMPTFRWSAVPLSFLLWQLAVVTVAASSGSATLYFSSDVAALGSSSSAWSTATDGDSSLPLLALRNSTGDTVAAWRNDVLADAANAAAAIVLTPWEYGAGSNNNSRLNVSAFPAWPNATSPVAVIGHVPLCLAIAVNKANVNLAAAASALNAATDVIVPAALLRSWVSSATASTTLRFVSAADGRTTPVRTAQTAFLLSSCNLASSVCASLVESLVASPDAEAAFVAAKNLLPDSNAVTHSTHAEVLNVLQGGSATLPPYLIAAVPAYDAYRLGLRCASIETTSTSASSSTPLLFRMSDGLDRPETLFTAFTVEESLTATTTDLNGTATPFPYGPVVQAAPYPLWATVAVYPAPSATCDARRALAQTVKAAVGEPSSALRRWLRSHGVQRPATRTRVAAMAAVEAFQCRDSEPTLPRQRMLVPRPSSLGSITWTDGFNAARAPDDSIAQLSVLDSSNNNASPFTLLLPSNTSTPMVTTDRVRVPLAQLPLLLVANVDVDANDGTPLVLPRCLIRDAFYVARQQQLLRQSQSTVAATTWSDARVAALNPFIASSLPSTPIVAVRFDAHLGVVVDQLLDRLASVCPPLAVTTAPLVPAAQSTFLAPHNTRARVLATVSLTPGAIAFVPVEPGVAVGDIAAGLRVVEVYDEDAGWSTAVDSAPAHLAALAATTGSNGTQSEDAVRSSSPPPRGVYPFVSLIEAEFATAHTASSPEGCSDYSTAIRLFYYASGLPNSGLPSTWTAYARSHLEQAKCNGKVVLRGPSSSSMSIATIVVAVTVPLGMLLIVVVSFAVLQWFRSATRDTANAPKRPPFAVVFTDIQSSTSLWAQVPEQMGSAVDAHHEIIRRVIRRNRCYEVKTIGDSFMIVTDKPSTAVKLANEIQKRLFEHNWGTSAIDRTYRDLLGDSKMAMPNASSGNYRSLWNGLRVRIGIDYGEGQIRFDQVSKGYDYYGTVVNSAARIEALGHGGMILASAAIMHHLPESFLRDQKLYIDYLGPQELRGLTEPMDLYHLVPKRFTQREFDELRYEHAAHANADSPNFGIGGDGGNSGDVDARIADWNNRRQSSDSHVDRVMSFRSGDSGVPIGDDPSDSASDAVGGVGPARRRSAPEVTPAHPRRTSGTDTVPANVATRKAAAAAARGGVAASKEANVVRSMMFVEELDEDRDDDDGTHSPQEQLYRKRTEHEQCMADDYHEKLEHALSACKMPTKIQILSQLMRDWRVEPVVIDMGNQSTTSSSAGSGGAAPWVQGAEFSRNLLALAAKLAKVSMKRSVSHSNSPTTTGIGKEL
jgi:class 3 adenylate cyclase